VAGRRAGVRPGMGRTLADPRAALSSRGARRLPARGRAHRGRQPGRRVRRPARQAGRAGGASWPPLPGWRTRPAICMERGVFVLTTEIMQMNWIAFRATGNR
jgi:hypothetical protein